MGLGGQVIGRSTYCTYPPEVQAVPAVGDTLQLNLQEVIRLKPTIALVITRREEVPRCLEGLGVRCVALQSDRMNQMLDAIRTIGRETGHEADAQNLLDRSGRTWAACAEASPVCRAPRSSSRFP
jgi:iron complex transport system substrate-binding protein